MEKVKQSKKQEAEKYNHSNNELISKVRKISELLFELENNEESEELLINYNEKVNSLLSTISITEWFLYPHSYENKIQCLSPFFFDEV